VRVSSAYKIQYEVRPSKQTERRLILDILRAATEAGVKLERYKYVGFGGVRFYDFEMIFRHLGIRDMTSIELDKSLFARCRFNKPFGFIDFKEGRLCEYLEKTGFKKPVVAWLDYDCVLTSGAVSDMQAIGTSVPVGSFVFATIDARIPEGLRSLRAQDRFAAITEDYGKYALAQSPGDLSPENFPLFAERVLWASLSESLSRRSDGEFIPLMRAFYKDTTLMITIGGCLSDRDTSVPLRKRIKRDFGFLVPRNGKPYAIPSFNLTPRERQLLDAAVTRKQHERGLDGGLRKLGFSSTEVNEYRRMLRFIPKYVESYV